MKAVQALASYCPYTKIKSLNLIAALKTNLANPAHERDKEGTDVRSASNFGPVPGQQRVSIISAVGFKRTFEC